MIALYQPRTGFSDSHSYMEEVTILGFAVADIEPGYQRSGRKRCTVAIIADKNGRLSQAELCDLTYQRGSIL